MTVRGESHRLTPTQQGMLYEHLAGGDTRAHVEQVVGVLREAIDLDAFKMAWALVSHRHDALRLRYVWRGLAEPRCVVDPPQTPPLELRDWRHLDPNEQDYHFAEYLELDRSVEFDLGCSPLGRIALFQLGASLYKMVWTYHRIALDARSVAIVLGEVFDLHDSLCSGIPLAQEAPGRFWDNLESLRHREDAREEAFWRTRLASFKAPTRLGIEPSRPLAAADGYGRSEEVCRLSQKTTDALNALAREQSVGLDTVALAAWALLLSRYSGQERVLFGLHSPGHCSCRHTGPSVGNLSSVLPVAIGVPPAARIVPWLKVLREEQLSLRRYEHSPLGMAQRCSRIRAGEPFLGTLVAFHEQSLDARLKARGPAWQQREFRLLAQADFPVTLTLTGGEELEAAILYDERQYEAVGIRRVLGHVRAVLEAIADNPEYRLNQLPTLTRAELRRLAVAWNDTRVEPLPTRCVHDQFRDQARRTPNRVAVVSPRRSLTYAELDRLSDRLASRLVALGIGPERLVGVSAGRSCRMMVGLLAILKAGGAYLPLDAALPHERLAHILAESEASVLVVEEHLARLLPPTQAIVVLLDDQGSEDAPIEPPAVDMAPHNLVYATYGGGHGPSAAVLVEHRQVANFLAAMDGRVPHGEHDVWLATTSLAVDGAVLELLWTLARGFTVVLQPCLAETIHRYGVTHLQCTPSMAMALLGDGESRGALEPLRHLLLGGEPVSRELLAQLRRATAAEVRTAFGVPEATVWSAMHVMHDPDGPLAIGRPLANTEIWVLDGHGQPCPVGVCGELCIGGAGIARGYLNRPELTAERFSPHPFRRRPGARLFRTGARARFREDGGLYLELVGTQPAREERLRVTGFEAEHTPVPISFARLSQSNGNSALQPLVTRVLNRLKATVLR